MCSGSTSTRRFAHFVDVLTDEEMEEKKRQEKAREHVSELFCYFFGGGVGGKFFSSECPSLNTILETGNQRNLTLVPGVQQVD